MLWDYCHSEVIVMERMNGVPIAQTRATQNLGVDLRQLARDGVTFVLHPGLSGQFFRTDMHPAIFKSASSRPHWGAISRWTLALWAL